VCNGRYRQQKWILENDCSNWRVFETVCYGGSIN
jgi:hypothetical protein